MVGERKKMAQPVNIDAMEAARQAFLKEHLPNKSDNVLSLHKGESEVKETEPEIAAQEESVQDQPQEQEQNTEQAIKKETEEEILAREKGWLPLEEYKGNKAYWRDAKNWLNNTESVEIHELKRLNREILDYLRSKDKKEIDITIAELKQKKRDAIAAADVDAVEKIEAQIAAINSPPQPKELPVGQNPPEVDDFLHRNEWFHTNKEMKQFAIDAENRYATLNPSMSLAERLRKTEQDTLKFYSKEDKPNVAPVAVRGGFVSRNLEPKYDELDSIVRGLVDHYVTKSEFISRQNKGKTKPTTRNQYISKLYKSGAIDKMGRLISSK